MNDFSPETQPWLRTVKDINAEAAAKLKHIEQETNLQYKTLAASLGAVERRIDKLNELALAAPYVTSDEGLVYYSGAGLTPNTWGTISNYNVATPAGKTNVSVIVFCFAAIQTSSGDNIHQFRAGVDGVFYPSTVNSEGYPNGGFGSCVFSAVRSYSGIGSSINITVQYNSPQPNTLVSSGSFLATSYTAVFT